MKRSTRFDLVARVVLCTLIPGFLVAMRNALPMGGIFVNIVLILTMVTATEWMGRFATVPLLGKVIRRLQRIPAYYAEHPPRSVFYYLCYPLLAPYWLIKREARREFGLYKAFSVMTVLILVVGGTIEYLRLWRPEIRVEVFVGASIATVILQLVITMVLVMPLVTTVTLLRAGGHRRTLIVMAVLAGALLVPSWFSTRHLTPSRTISRLRFRTEAVPGRATRAIDAGLHDAWQVLGDAPDGRIGGPALDAARADLRQLYKPDEVDAFRLFLSDGKLLLYVPNKTLEPIWRGLDRFGEPVTTDDRLTPALRHALDQQP